MILTIIVIKFFLEFVDGLIPQEYLPEAVFNLETSIPGSGIILLLLIILITGILVTNILGRRLVALLRDYSTEFQVFETYTTY